MIIGPKKIKNTFILHKQRAANFQAYNKLSECLASKNRICITLEKDNHNGVGTLLDFWMLKTWRRYNVSMWSENWLHKDNVVTTLLWDCRTFWLKDNQKPTLSQRRVPVGIITQSFNIQIREIGNWKQSFLVEFTEDTPGEKVNDLKSKNEKLKTKIKEFYEYQIDPEFVKHISLN